MQRYYVTTSKAPFKYRPGDSDKSPMTLQEAIVKFSNGCRRLKDVKTQYNCVQLWEHNCEIGRLFV